jgi:hypothetical protein
MTERAKPEDHAEGGTPQQEQQFVNDWTIPQEKD